MRATDWVRFHCEACGAERFSQPFYPLPRCHQCRGEMTLKTWAHLDPLFSRMGAILAEVVMCL